ncbi:MAG: hypothetical protein ABI355_09970 [Solirubrobacteraceae bacterium]
MNADVGLLHAPLDQIRVQDAAADQSYPSARLSRPQIQERTSAEVIEHHDFVSAGDQPVGQMGADKTGTPGYQHPRPLKRGVVSVEFQAQSLA